MRFSLSRRMFMQSSAASAATALLSACGSTPKPTARPTRSTVQKVQTMPSSVQAVSSADNSMRLIASSGFAESAERVNLALTRLYQAGFSISNHQAGFRRYQRFAGTDAERVADFQDIASGRVPTPKVIMGLRGGYGAARILPNIDFASLGARMRERGTLFFGFSDVCAIQLALLAKGNMMSFAGPMAYGDFGKTELNSFTMDSFIHHTTQPTFNIDVVVPQTQAVNTEGILWGGNLSVLASLVGTPYLPDISDGILFLEDVGEQPYRIERMLNTLYLAGILKKQRAIVFGDFRMGNIRDTYDSSYDLSAVINQITRVTRVPVLTGFPFGHISNKATFPLGSHAKISSHSDGGYSIYFQNYPTLNASALLLDTLLPATNEILLNTVTEETIE